LIGRESFSSPLAFAGGFFVTNNHPHPHSHSHKSKNEDENDVNFVQFG